MIDRCEAATVTETDIDHSSTEDRRACESVAETPGDGRMLNVNGPLQLGGKSNTRTKYPNGLLRDGFNGCIKNFFHNGQVTALDICIDSLYGYSLSHYSYVIIEYMYISCFLNCCLVGYIDDRKYVR